MKTLTLNGRRMLLEHIGCREFAVSFATTAPHQRYIINHSDLWHVAHIKYHGIGMWFHKPAWVKGSSKDLLDLTALCRPGTVMSAPKLEYSPVYPALAKKYESVDGIIRPRKIPHVRMVRAAALQPGMFVYVDERTRDQVIKVTPISNAMCVRFTRHHWHVLREKCRTEQHYKFMVADQVVPVFIEWRDKVAL